MSDVIRVADVPYTERELRMFARGVRDAHDATKQGHNYDRCSECNFTRHPCDTFDMASAVLVLLDKAAES